MLADMDKDINIDTDRQVGTATYHGSHDEVRYHEFAYGRQMRLRLLR
jgi:hypothetical protein